MDLQTFIKKLRASPRTKALYLQNLLRYERWLGKKSNSHKNAQAYIHFLEEAGKEPSTIAVAANALRAYFKKMETEIDLDAPSVQMKDPDYLTVEEVLRLIAASRNPLEKCMITVLFDTACRIGELLNLHLDDIDYRGGFIRVTRKGGRIADVNISDIAMAELKNWIEVRAGNHKRVFMDYVYNDIWRLLKDLAARARIERFTPHKLRHSRAVQMLDAGLTLHDIQEALGHRSITTTANIYGRRKPADLKKVLAKAPWMEKEGGKK